MCIVKLLRNITADIYQSVVIRYELMNPPLLKALLSFVFDRKVIFQFSSVLSNHMINFLVKFTKRVMRHT